MCSLHPRSAKKFGEEFQTLRDQISTEATDDTVYRIKVTKQKARDEFLMLTGCASAEKYLKALDMPTPPARQLLMLQNNLENILKALR